MVLLNSPVLATKHHKNRSLCLVFGATTPNGQGPRDLYLTTHNTQNRQTSMSPVGFKPTISAGERPQT
jgi:hypothetical protein